MVGEDGDLGFACEHIAHFPESLDDGESFTFISSPVFLSIFE